MCIIKKVKCLCGLNSSVHNKRSVFICLLPGFFFWFCFGFFGGVFYGGYFVCFWCIHLCVLLGFLFQFQIGSLFVTLLFLTLVHKQHVQTCFLFCLKEILKLLACYMYLYKMRLESIYMPVVRVTFSEFSDTCSLML